MARPLVIVLFLIFALFTTVDSSVETAPLWPLPARYSLLAPSTSSQIGHRIAKLFSFDINISDINQLVNSALKRYTAFLRLDTVSSQGDIKSCSIKVADLSSSIPIINADESYKIQISNSGDCYISSANTWGLLRGLETFSQLLIRDGGELVLPYSEVSIEDSSRFGHRGLLIDTARHYISVTEILRLIDTLAMNKFNVLHWHTVDAESFPLNTPSEPTMINGAFSSSMIYTMDEVNAIKNYAYDRGVEVLLEIDIPGHAAGWNAGKPTIMADCFAKYYYNINDFALNPALEETYTTIQNILSDLSSVTSSTRVHLGGDEVVYGCWKEDASITVFMSEQGFTSYDQLYSYFIQRVDEIANKLGMYVTHWEEVFSAGCKVPNNTYFQVWTNSSQISALTAAEYPVIASPSNYWYLNIATNTWSHMYSYDPYVDLTAQQQALILGGEVAMWGEYIDDLNIEQNIFPRACSVAERLWSPANVTDTTDALNRLVIQRCRMVNRGVQSAPVQPASYCSTQYV